MMRVGLGYDIHRIVSGRPLFLGGVRIPAPFGLLGHSDADVALHALMDALLGAAGLGDIGRHFPPSDEAYRDASSVDLLQRVRVMLEESGYHPVNVDIVVVAEAPRIAPYARDMQDHIAGALGIAAASVSIKATTNERVGPEGREEAISAQAVALVERR
jgi:2-C-methyl-D-erythritol 2,4-cyclodiphosphate synthase